MRSIAKLIVMSGATTLALSTMVGCSTKRPAYSEPVAYTVDTSHSTVIYTLSYRDVGLFQGRMNMISGELIWDESNPTNSSINVTVPTASMDSNDGERDKLLTGEMYLDAENHPEARFTSTAIRRVGLDRYRATGELAMRGTTLPVEFDFQRTGITADGERIAGEANLTFDRSEYGMVDRLTHLGAEVTLVVVIHGVRRK